MSLLENINIPAFREPLNYYLINNITPKTCSTLANMLAMDYLVRIDSKETISKHADICVNRLRTFLGQKVITDESFSTALTLFAIAISPEKPQPNENDILDQSQSQDLIMEALIETHFKNIGDKKMVKKILKEMLKSKKFNELINYINSEPEMICSIIEYALRKYPKQHEIINYVNIETAKIFDQDIQLNKKIDSFKQATSKIALAASTLAVGALAVITAGTVLTIAIVPAAILAVRYAPKIGEVLGENLLQADSNIKTAKDNIKSLASQLYQKNQLSLAVSKEQSIEQNKSQSPHLSTINDKSLGTIKERLTEHINKDQSISLVTPRSTKTQGNKRGI